MPAGYSGTPLPAKLGIKPGSRVVVLNTPPKGAPELTDLPPGAEVSTRLPRTRPFDVGILFARSGKDLERSIARVAARMSPDGGLWIAWPKRASGVPTDLDESVVRRAGLALRLVDNKVCAISDIWSGLRFVVPLKDRPGR
jgi:hypothetical protein